MRSILLESESETNALGMIQALVTGGDFATLARERSHDASSESGGDLGWLQPTTMWPEFGSHVIQPCDKRDAAKPDYKAVKPGLQQILVREQLARKVVRPGGRLKPQSAHNSA